MDGKTCQPAREATLERRGMLLLSSLMNIAMMLMPEYMATTKRWPVEGKPGIL